MQKYVFIFLRQSANTIFLMIHLLEMVSQSAATRRKFSNRQPTSLTILMKYNDRQYAIQN